MPTSEVRFTCKQEAIWLIQITLTRLIYGVFGGGIPEIEHEFEHEFEHESYFPSVSEIDRYKSLYIYNSGVSLDFDRYNTIELQILLYYIIKYEDMMLV